MRLKVIAILLCIACICTITGCGSRVVSESVEASASPQEAFGNAPVASPELAAQTAQTEICGLFRTDPIGDRGRPGGEYG